MEGTTLVNDPDDFIDQLYLERFGPAKPSTDKRWKHGAVAESEESYEPVEYSLLSIQEAAGEATGCDVRIDLNGGVHRQWSDSDEAEWLDEEEPLLPVVPKDSFFRVIRNDILERERYRQQLIAAGKRQRRK